MGGRSVKVASLLKNVKNADQLKGNRLEKKCRKKKVFTLF